MRGDYRTVRDAAHAAIAAFDAAPAGIAGSEHDEAAAALRTATAELLDVLDGGES